MYAKHTFSLVPLTVTIRTSDTQFITTVWQVGIIDDRLWPHSVPLAVKAFQTIFQAVHLRCLITQCRNLKREGILVSIQFYLIGISNAFLQR